MAPFVDSVIMKWLETLIIRVRIVFRYKITGSQSSGLTWVPQSSVAVD